MKKFALVAVVCFVSGCSLQPVKTAGTGSRTIASQYRYSCTWKAGDSQATLGTSTAKISVGPSTTTGEFTGLTGQMVGNDDKPIDWGNKPHALSFSATYNPNYVPHKKNKDSNMVQYVGDDDLGIILQGWDNKYILVDTGMRSGAATGHMRTASLFDTSYSSDLFTCTAD